MRIAVIGGTNFVGPAILQELLTAGHEPIVIHRGASEPDDVPPARHVHCDRRDAVALRRALQEVMPDAVVDTCAHARADAEALAAALPPNTRVVVLSSMDVYRAFGALDRGGASDPVPLYEDSPLREERYIRRGQPTSAPGFDPNPDSYEKLDVEPIVLSLGAVVLRVPMVYGPLDYRRREECVLHRVRAGRRRIPFGAGGLLWSRLFVRDLARAVRLAAEVSGLEGALMNVAERRTWTMEQWARRVLAAAQSEATLVKVPDEKLPPDLWLTGSRQQHQLIDASRARTLLGWHDEVEPTAALSESVRWHLAHPPPNASADFTEDDKALEGASE